MNRLTTFLTNEDGNSAKVQMHGNTQLSNELVSELTQVLDRVEDAGVTKVIIIEVIGESDPSFIHHWPGQIDARLASKWERLLRRVERASPVTIVVGEQVCSLLALEVLLVADYRICTKDFVVESKLSHGSIWPGMAIYRLSRQIGEIRARKLFLERSNITAIRALEVDLIDQVLDASGAVSEHLALFIDQAPLRDFAVRRRLMQDSFSTTYEDALGAHLAACDRTLRRAADRAR